MRERETMMPTPMMIFNRRLLETEQRAIKAVDNVIIKAEQAYDTGFRKVLGSECSNNKPSQETFAAATTTNNNNNEKSHLDDLTDLLEAYFETACHDAAAHFRAMLYKILYQNWKDSLPDGNQANSSLVDWVHDLPEAVCEATRAKVKRIMASLVSVQKLQLFARELVYPTLQKFQERAHKLVEQKVDTILEPDTAEADKNNGLERLENDALSFIQQQLLTQLLADQKQANSKLYEFTTDLFKETIQLDGYSQSLQKWADNALMDL